MTEEKKGWLAKTKAWFAKFEWLAKFMDIHYLLPYGNGGRGTKIYLYPFVFVAVVSIAAPLINFAIYGNF